MTQPLVSEPCDTPDRVTIFMNVTDRPYSGRFLTTIADADERRMTTRRYRRRRRSTGRSRTYPVTKRGMPAGLPGWGWGVLVCGPQEGRRARLVPEELRRCLQRLGTAPPTATGY